MKNIKNSSIKTTNILFTKILNSISLDIEKKKYKNFRQIKNKTYKNDMIIVPKSLKEQIEEEEDIKEIILLKEFKEKIQEAYFILKKIQNL